MTDVLKQFIKSLISTQPSDVQPLKMDNDNDYAKFKKIVEGYRSDLKKYNSPFAKSIIDMFNIDELLDELDEIADELHSSKQPKYELPSKKVSLDRQANIHKIVKDYVDTMIRPYSKDGNEKINDRYADLFEFACWLLNK